MAEYEEPVKLDTTTECIKLYKNTKGYNWEIKILSTDLNRINELNSQMLKRFGPKNEDKSEA